MSTLDNYNRWLNSSRVDDATKAALKAMDQKEIDDAFFKDVEFGTAGMRGVLGPGTNRLNDFTVRKATVAFGKYLLEIFPNAKKEGVVISHDNRHMSREFTLLSAQVLNDLGIKTYIFDSLRPTPELSFAVRYLKACGGIMITASHNPKEYNGLKVSRKDALPVGFDTGLGELEQKILHEEVKITAPKGKIVDYPVKQEYL